MTDATRIFIDIETFHPTLDVRKVGAWKYAEECEIMLMAFAVDDGPVEVCDLTAAPDQLERGAYTVGEMPEWLRDWAEAGAIFVAHNCQFERACIREYLHVDIPIEQWEDTAVLALINGYPPALGMLGEALRLPQDVSKDRDGKRLIQKFCAPRKPSKHNPDVRWDRENAPEDWARFRDYCARDVETMRVIHGKLPRFNWTERERDLWYLDQRINERGLPIDTGALDTFIDEIEKETNRLNEELAELTFGFVEKATQRSALLSWLESAYGVRLAGLTKHDVTTALSQEGLPPDARRVLQIRQQVSKTSNAKFKKLRDCVCRDDRMRGTLQFYGAFRTGRWAGRLFQPQNLPSRDLIPDPEVAIDALMTGGVAALKVLYSEALVDIASACIRGMVKAPEGQAVCASDLAGIEARVLPWMALDDEGLDVFRQKRDVYKFRAAQIFGVPEESISKSDVERLVGKVAELAFGYQGSVAAFRSMMMNLGIPQDMFTDKEIRKFVKGYRAGNEKTRSLWSELENTAITAMKNPDQAFECRRVAFTYRPGLLNGMLLARLPSGRCLVYVEPELGTKKIKFLEPRIADALDDLDTADALETYASEILGVRVRRGDVAAMRQRIGVLAAKEIERPCITYMGMDPDRYAWSRLNTYGGKLTENLDQAISRDVIAHNLPAVEAAGFEIITLVHDEDVTLTRADRANAADELSAILSTNPPWAEGLPLAAAGFTADRYGKD